MKWDLTPYQKLSSMQLYAMYRQETWNGLTESQKLGVLQETVKREAAQHGNVYSAEVSFASLGATIKSPSGILKPLSAHIRESQK